MANNKIKLICSDIDHTLLDASKGQVPQRNIDAVRKALDMGIYFVLNSGRSYDSMKYYGDILGLPADGCVCTLGGSLIFEGTNIVDSHVIDREIALKIVETADEMGLFTHSFCKREWFSTSHDFWYETERKALMVEGQHYIPMEYFKEHDPHKLVVLSEDPAKLNRFVDYLKAFANDITVSYSLSSCMEINPAGVSKGTGIAFLCGLLGIRQSEVLSVGDYYNDVEMFKVSGFSAAMEDAPNEVKAASTAVVSSSMECGLAEALEKFVFQ